MGIESVTMASTQHLLRIALGKVKMSGIAQNKGNPLEFVFQKHSLYQSRFSSYCAAKEHYLCVCLFAPLPLQVLMQSVNYSPLSLLISLVMNACPTRTCSITIVLPRMNCISKPSILFLTSLPRFFEVYAHHHSVSLAMSC